MIWRDRLRSARAGAREWDAEPPLSDPERWESGDDDVEWQKHCPVTFSGSQQNPARGLRSVAARGVEFLRGASCRRLLVPAAYLLPLGLFFAGSPLMGAEAASVSALSLLAGVYIGRRVTQATTS